VRLNVVLVDSPTLEDAEDPLQSKRLELFPDGHVTFYVGAANSFPGDTTAACQEGPPCPENYRIHIPDLDNDELDEGPFLSVVMGEDFLVGAVAIGIEKTKTYEDSIDRSGQHPRIRGCFFDVGRIGPSADKTLVIPILLRPAPGECE
jgi:hypothetical protein